MQVKNIECQIAQAQLRRYLTGEEMPNVIVTDLETHLRHCPECMSAAQTLRESLKSVLSGKITGKPEAPKQVLTPAALQDEVITLAETSSQAVPIGRAVVQSPLNLLDAPDSDFRPKKAPRKSNLKTLLYTSALAALLVLMSTVFRDPTRLFGPRASTVVKDIPPAAANDTPPADPVTTDTGQIEPAATGKLDTEAREPVETTEPATSAAPTGRATTPTADPTPSDTTRLQTDGLIIADGVQGTRQIKTDAPKPRPKATAKKKKKPTGGRPGIGTIRVYPPVK